MVYLENINSYLHQSSLLIQAYPTTTCITTKYSLPKKRKTKPATKDPATHPGATSDGPDSKQNAREQQPPAATLTFKTFETTAGICLKYQTNKSAEVGRLMTGLGRLAKGEVVEEPSSAGTGIEAKESKLEDTMDIDAPAPKAENVPELAVGTGKAKKKKGKK